MKNSGLSTFRDRYYSISDALVGLESVEIPVTPIGAIDKIKRSDLILTKQEVTDQDEYQAILAQMRFLLDRAGDIVKRRVGQWD